MDPTVHLSYREGLRNWLRTATKRLCIEAKRRIYQEIYSHYIEAVDACREAGLSDDEAHDRALASLGSPRKASRSFRKTHLTEYQARLPRIVLLPRRRHVLIVAMVCATWILGLFLGLGLFRFTAHLFRPLEVLVAVLAHKPVPDPPSLLDALALLPLCPFVWYGTVVLTLFILGLARRSAELVILSILVVTCTLVIVNCSTLVMYLVPLLYHDSPAPDAIVHIKILAPAIAVYLVATWMLLSIWLKLRRGADFTDPRGRAE